MEVKYSIQQQVAIFVTLGYFIDPSESELKNERGRYYYSEANTLYNIIID